MAFAFLGVELEACAVVRRLDLATDVRFADPTDGLLFLRTFGGTHLGGFDQDRRTSREQTRTVAWTPGRNVALRLYDAGHHHGTDPPGTRLRLERQLRWRKPQQMAPESITPALVRPLYLGPLRKLIDVAPAVHLLPPRLAELALIDKARSGELSLAIAERQIGVLRVKELGLDATLYDRETATRRQRELHRTGVVLDVTGETTTRRFDVRAVLVALDRAWESSEERL